MTGFGHTVKAECKGSRQDAATMSILTSKYNGASAFATNLVIFLHLSPCIQPLYGAYFYYMDNLFKVKLIFVVSTGI